MKQLFRIVGLQFRLVLQNKVNLVLMFLLPLVFTALVSGMSGGGSSEPDPFPLAVIRHDDGLAAEHVVAALTADAALEITEAAEDELALLFADQKIMAAVVIPAGSESALAAGEGPELQVVTAPGSNDHLAVKPVVMRAVTTVASHYSLARRLAAGDTDAALRDAYDRVALEREAIGIGVTQAVATDPGEREGARASLTAIGLIILFMMMSVLIGCGAILHERQGGTWGRLLASPVSRSAVLGGYLVSFFAIGAFQFAVLVGASSLFFNVYWGPPLPLIAVAAALILCTTGLGLFLAGLVTSGDQQRNLSIIVVIVTSMLGGVYWPLEMVTETMQKIGRWMPQAWALAGLKEVMLRGGDWAAVAVPVTALLGMAAVLMAIGIARVRFE